MTTKRNIKEVAEISGKYIIETDVDGKRIYKWRDGAELDTYDMELLEFINYCLFPIEDFARLIAESDDEPQPEAIVIERLYDGAMAKIEQMIEEFEKRTGTTKIIMARSVCRDFLRQDTVDVTREIAKE
jgi:hypothetical protein